MPLLQGLETFIAFMGVLGGRQKPQSGCGPVCALLQDFIHVC